MIRNECVAPGLNRSKGRGCTDDDLCVQCWMSKDVEQNREFYQALGDTTHDSK